MMIVGWQAQLNQGKSQYFYHGNQKTGFIIKK